MGPEVGPEMREAGRPSAPLPYCFRSLILGLLSLAENAIYRGAADRALALRHATTRVRDVDRSFELALLFALHAIGLTLICFSHSFLRSSQGSSACECPHHTPALRSNPRNPRSMREFSSPIRPKCPNF